MKFANHSIVFLIITIIGIGFVYDSRKEEHCWIKNKSNRASLVSRNISMVDHGRAHGQGLFSFVFIKVAYNTLFNQVNL